MKRYLVYHTLPADLTGEKIQQMAIETQKTPGICGLRSYLNLTEHTGVCVFDADNAEALRKFFVSMNMPYDRIVPIEWEGDHGKFGELKTLETVKV